MKQLLGLAILLALTACSQSDVFKPSIGNCFDDDLAFNEEVSDLPFVECSEPHDNEIYAIHRMTDVTYPGVEATGGLADEWCVDEFESFVGVAYDVSELDIGWLAPTEDSWSGGDREIVCFLYRLDLEKLSGTMEGSGV
ncbi:MAG: septum formation family protein [Acidimicrobiia bacterium]